MNYGLAPNDWQIIENVLLKPLKREHCDLWVFGSRAKGNFRSFSDLDILYQEHNPLPLGLIAEIKMNLEDSDLPIKVDLVSLNDLSAAYRDDVLKSRRMI